MYSTKRVNPRMVDGGAYISIGDPYKGMKDKLPDRWNGKGFTIPMRPANAENGNFGKLEYKSEPFVEMEKFAKTQPLDKRKNGFGTKDAVRRGEFTATIRTEQYRDLLRKEQALMDAHRDVVGDREVVCRVQKKMAEERTFPEGMNETRFLYDIGRSQVTNFDPKHSRDRFYTLAVDREKRRGPLRTMSQDIGDGAWEYKYKSPEFGPIHFVKFFFDKSHLHLPEN